MAHEEFCINGFGDSMGKLTDCHRCCPNFRAILATHEAHRLIANPFVILEPRCGRNGKANSISSEARGTHLILKELRGAGSSYSMQVYAPGATCVTANVNVYWGEYSRYFIQNWTVC